MYSLFMHFPPPYIEKQSNMWIVLWMKLFGITICPFSLSLIEKVHSSKWVFRDKLCEKLDEINSGTTLQVYLWTFWAQSTDFDMLIDPLGQPKVTAGRDHCFRTSPYVLPHFSNLAKQNNRKQCSLLAWLWAWPSRSLMTSVLYII